MALNLLMLLLCMHALLHVYHIYGMLYDFDFLCMGGRHVGRLDVCEHVCGLKAAFLDYHELEVLFADT